MNNQNSENISLLHLSSLSNEKELFHFISTRIGGVSRAPYSSLNLGFGVKDRYEDVLKNRLLLAHNVGIPLESFTLSQQVHSGNVYTVSERDKGKGAYSYDTGIPQTDALITNIPGIALMVLAADCTPILFFDKKNKVIGAAHSGRIGVVNEVAINTILRMQQEYNSLPENILVGLGPSICCKHYPISEDKKLVLQEALENTQSICLLNEKITFDLSIAIKEQLLSVGILEHNIEQIKLCTYEEEELLFSERRNGPPAGRFGAAIIIN